MSNVTLEGIAALLKEELKPIHQTLQEHTETLARHSDILSEHTAALEILLKDKERRTDNNTVVSRRVERIEHWTQEVGQKVGIKLKL